MVSTHLKNNSQIGSFPQVRMKIKNIWNHHLESRIILNTRFDLNGQQCNASLTWSALFPVQGMGANWSDRTWIELEMVEKENEGDQIERGSRASVFDHNTEPNQHKIRTHNKTTSFLMTPPYHTPRKSILRAGWDGKIKVITWNPFSFRQNGIEKHQLIKCLI